MWVSARVCERYGCRANQEYSTVEAVTGTRFLTLSYSNFSDAFSTLFQTDNKPSASDAVAGRNVHLSGRRSDMTGFLAVLARGITGLAAKKCREVSGV